MCVCPCVRVCQPRAYPRDNLSPIQAGITKFAPEVQNTLQGQIKRISENLHHFELVHKVIHRRLKLGFPNFDQIFILALSRSILILGLIEIVLEFNVDFRIYFCSELR